MKIQVIIILLIVQLSAFCQLNIDKSSIDSGGASVKTGNISIIYTLGEVARQEVTKNSIHLSEGFLSPELSVKVSIEGFDLIDAATVFPNPTADFITIGFSKVDNYSIFIFDNSGQLIQKSKYLSKEISIDMSNYNSGFYQVLIKTKDNKQYKAYKIIKQ